MNSKPMVTAAAKRTGKRHPIHHSTVEPAANGYVVKHHFRPKDAKADAPEYMGMPEPQTHVFSGPNAADQVGAHMAATLNNGAPAAPDAAAKAPADMDNDGD